jgi:hypothetical protein
MADFCKKPTVVGTRRRTVRSVLGAGVVASVLSLCLFGNCQVTRESGALGPILGEVAEALRDDGTQWMVFACAGTYFVTFGLLRARLGGDAERGEDSKWRTEDGESLCRRGHLRETPAFWAGKAEARPRGVECGTCWLVLLLAVTGVTYALHYAGAAHSTEPVVLLTGAVLGQGAALWAERSPKSKVQSVKSGRGTVAGALIFMLVGAAVWQAETPGLFQYRGQARWSGPWDNPNTFGALMGVGLVLAVGQIVHSPLSSVHSLPANCWVRVKRALLLAAAGAMAFGLVKSYSRGAWVGAAVGMAYLAYEVGKAEMLELETLKAVILQWGARRWRSLAIVCASVAVLAFWSFRDTGSLVGRRAYSVVNANDFSWRARLIAFEGLLQMLADKPWFGFGWNQPERVGGTLYRPAKVGEGMAIQLNDYLVLGATLGVPALGCFGMYLWLSLARPSPITNCKSQMAEWEWEKPVCRAGAVVLLVGFWFDGGLFKLATGATFWILLELGSSPAARMESRGWRMEGAFAET